MVQLDNVPPQPEIVDPDPDAPPSDFPPSSFSLAATAARHDGTYPSQGDKVLVQSDQWLSHWLQAAADSDPEKYLHIPVTLSQPHQVRDFKFCSRDTNTQTGIPVAHGIEVLSVDTKAGNGETCDVWWTPLVTGDLTEFGPRMTGGSSLASCDYVDQYNRTQQHPTLSVRILRPTKMSDNPAGRPISFLRRLEPGEQSARPDLDAMGYTLEPLFRDHPDDTSLQTADFKDRHGDLWFAKDTPDWHVVSSALSEVGINGQWYPLYRESGIRPLHPGQGGQFQAYDTGRYVVAGSLVATNWQSARSNSEHDGTEASGSETRGEIPVEAKP